MMSFLPFGSGHSPSEPFLMEILAMAQASAFYQTYFGKFVSYIASQVGEILCFKLLYIYLNEYCRRNMIVIADQDEFPI